MPPDIPESPENHSRSQKPHRPQKAKSDRADAGRGADGELRRRPEEIEEERRQRAAGERAEGAAWPLRSGEGYSPAPMTTATAERELAAVCHAIAPTLRAMDGALSKQHVMAWFRGRVAKAAEEAGRVVEAEARREKDRQEHARRILDDCRAGKSRYTDRRRPPEDEGWRWSSEKVGRPAEEREKAGRAAKGARRVSEVVVRPQDTVEGWFPAGLCENPIALRDTECGSAAILALVHDFCLIEKLEPQNPKRIVPKGKEDGNLEAEVSLFVGNLMDEGAEWAAAEIARRWELVSQALPAPAEPTGRANLAPSRLKAAAVYEWAIQTIPAADKMSIRDLFPAILEKLDATIAAAPPGAGEVEKLQELRDSLPDNAETFGRYLREAGIKRYNLKGERIQRISHFNRRGQL